MFWPWGPNGLGWLGGLLSAVFWIGLIVVGVLLLRRELPHMRVDRRSPALDLLEQRYARGEIGREEFFERRAVLLQEPNPATPGPEATQRMGSNPSEGTSPEPPPPPPPEEPPQLPTA
jgi:putative membrane protein